MDLAVLDDGEAGLESCADVLGVRGRAVDDLSDGCALNTLGLGLSVHLTTGELVSSRDIITCIGLGLVWELFLDLASLADSERVLPYSVHAYSGGVSALSFNFHLGLEALLALLSVSAALGAVGGTVCFGGSGLFAGN